MANEDIKSIQKQLMELQIEHRDLDDVVRRLSQDPMVDQLHLTRLKKRKLYLKDMIQRLKSRLIPDLDA
ncbi:MAG TPA: YdcH family protein [Gammaproteobacteria bacterium]|nr:YdcH family protein [Gammaproteobacteria bacterium]